MAVLSAGIGVSVVIFWGSRGRVPIGLMSVRSNRTCKIYVRLLVHRLFKRVRDFRVSPYKNKIESCVC